MSCPQFGYSNTSSSQLLMSNQATAAAAAAAAASGQTTPQLGSAATGCCESGRPIITDPLTGQSVCSCQYDPQTQLLNYQRLASAGLPLYGTPYTDQSYLPLSAEQSAFYTPTTNGFDLKDNLSAWPYAASVYYPYDTTLAGYPFTNGYGVDLNGARRKNATRETTSTLKAWLNEHKKNPYPTKGEKIMLAIITKMTLTQVSTWFANARRRLKKENKMTWEPRNRVDDEDNTADNADSTDKDGDKLRDGHERTLDSPPGPTREISVHSLHSRPPGLGLDKESGDDLCVRVGSADDDDDDDKSISVSIGGHDGLESSKPDGLLMSDSLSSPSSVLSDPASSIHSPLSVESQPQNIATGAATQCTDGVPNKPRIWSIVDTATSNPSPAGSSALYAVAAGGGGLGLAGGGTGGGGGGHMGLNSGSKLSPLARSLRLDYSTPYPKPTSWFNGSAAAAAAAAAYGAQAPTSAPSDGLLSSFAKPPTLMAAANPYSSLNSALTTSTITASRPCMQTVSSGLNKSLAQSAAGLSRSSPAAPRLHGAFTLNTKLDCQVHQDQRQELQGPAS